MSGPRPTTPGGPGGAPEALPGTEPATGLVPGTSPGDGPAKWRIGDVILDLYEVTALLGEGGMGQVHRVRHRGWNVDLAVKSPKPEIFARPDGQDGFVREAETWVELGLHPHVVSCHYVRRLRTPPTSGPGVCPCWRCSRAA